MDEKVETTNRGFSVIDFTDHNGVECSLQQSSAIDLSEDCDAGGSFLWLGCNKAEPKYFVPNGNPSWRPVEMPKDYVANTRMHLDRKHAAMLIRQLQSWLDTGDFAGTDDVLDADVING